MAATTSTSVVALRIGYFAARRPDADTVPAHEVAAWLSPRDAAELVRAAVETDGLQFLVASGISCQPLPPRGSAGHNAATELPTDRRRLEYEEL